MHGRASNRLLLHQPCVTNPVDIYPLETSLIAAAAPGGVCMAERLSCRGGCCCTSMSVGRLIGTFLLCSANPNMLILLSSKVILRVVRSKCSTRRCMRGWAWSRRGGCCCTGHRGAARRRSRTRSQTSAACPSCASPPRKSCPACQASELYRSFDLSI